MIPNITKGGDLRGLLGYLVGPGRANEHEDPHVISGDAYLKAWYGTEVLDQGSAVGIAGYVDAPRETFGTEVRAQVTRQDPDTGEKVVEGYKPQHVWHCSLSLAAEEGPLSDEKWDAIARDFMDRMGFTETSGKEPCRWVAIHHGESQNGNDHIHIAASMVRLDGTRWEGRWQDFPRSQEVCRELEAEHGLIPVAGRSAGQVAQRGEKPAERRQATQAGLSTTAPKELADRVRAAAVASASEAEWVRRVRAAGVVVKPRYAKGSTDVVVGYRAALKPADYQDKLAFYGGSSLGRDLSLPRLRENWPAPGVEAAGEAAAEWQAAFRGQAPTTSNGRESLGLDGLTANAQDVAAARLAGFNDRLTTVPVGDRAGWADAARDGAGVLSAWARFDPDHATELRAAAAAMSRSAQLRRAPLPPGRRVKESPMGTALILLASAPGTDKGKIAGGVFLRQVIKTAQALRDHHREAGQLREAQAIQRQVVERLERIQLVGYRTDLQPAEPATEAEREGRAAQRFAAMGSTARPPSTPPTGKGQSGTEPLPRPLATPRTPHERSRTQGPGRSGSEREGRE